MRYRPRQVCLCDPNRLLSSLPRFSAHCHARSLLPTVVNHSTIYDENPDLHHGLLGVRADPVREVGCKVSAVLHRTVDSDSFLEVNSNIPSTVFLKFKRAWPTPNLCPLWSTCSAATVWMMFCVYCAG